MPKERLLGSTRTPVARLFHTALPLNTSGVGLGVLKVAVPALSMVRSVRKTVEFRLMAEAAENGATGARHRTAIPEELAVDGQVAWTSQVAVESEGWSVTHPLRPSLHPLRMPLVASLAVLVAPVFSVTDPINASVVFEAVLKLPELVLLAPLSWSTPP